MKRGRGNRRLQRGQAMVEYSILTAALILGGGLGLAAFLPRVMNGLDAYLRGIYFMINLAIP